MTARMRAASLFTLFLLSFPAIASAARYRVAVRVLPDEDGVIVAQQVAAVAGGRVEEPAEAASGTFTLVATDSAAQILSNSPRVMRIEKIRSSAEQPPRPEIPGVTATSTWTTGTYAYDGSGNVKSITRTDFTERYVYDALGRLTSGKVASGRTEEYTYDDYGNRLTRTTDGGTPFTYGVDPATNRMGQTTSNVSATYDDAGRLTSVSSVGSFVYDALDVVTESTIGSVRVVHLYNASDERIASVTIANNAASSWNWTIREPGGQVLRRFTKPSGGNLAWTEDYVYRGTIMLVADVDAPEKRRVFHADHLGTPRLITGNGGTRIGLHTYYPFGTEITASQEGERKQFTGHERDTAILDYMHARYYGAVWGRFLSVDPVLDLKRAMRQPQGWNRYAYVENNPINHSDPTGKCLECVAQSGCIDCRDEIAAHVQAQLKITEIQQMADAGDPLARSINGTGRAEGLGLSGPIDTLVFGGALRIVRGAVPIAFSSSSAAESHFAKHGAEFGFKTLGQYIQGARSLIGSAGQRGVQSFTRLNGDRVIYRAATNEFAVVTRNNVIRTYFKPKGAVEYYVRQLFNAVEEKLGAAVK